MSDTPIRVQLSRAKGWRMPPNTVKVDRSTKFGNPWTVEKARELGYLGTDAELRAFCAGMFRNAVLRGLPAVATHIAFLQSLRGKNLACWCPPGEACHADVLLQLANMETRT